MRSCRNIKLVFRRVYIAVEFPLFDDQFIG